MYIYKTAYKHVSGDRLSKAEANMIVYQNLIYNNPKCCWKFFCNVYVYCKTITSLLISRKYGL